MKPARATLHRISRLWPALCIALTLALILLAFNPGCLNEDSISQWEQAMSRRYENWHPVTMSVLWTYLRYLYDGVQAMLVFQVMAFTAGLAMILGYGKGAWMKIVLFFAVIAVPSVLASLGSVVKDNVMGCLMVLAIGAFYWYSEGRSRLAFALTISASYLAFAVRHNAVIAVIPILALVYWEWLAPRGLKRALVLIPLILLFTMSCFVGLMKATSAAVHAVPGNPAQGLLLYDLAALSRDTGQNLAPRSFELPDATVPKIGADVDPYNGGALFWGGYRVYAFTENKANLKHLARTWLRAVWDHPADYLRWRWDVFRAFAGLDATVLQPYIATCIVPNAIGLAASDTWTHRAAMTWLGYFGQSLFFRCYFYLMLLTVILAYGFWTRRIDIVLISVSALAYGLAYFLIIYQSTFRFACPTVLMTAVLLARIAAERLQGRPQAG